MKRYLIYVSAIAAALALTFAAVAFGSREVVRAGNLYLVDNGGISPSKLPRNESAPITAHLRAQIGTVDGSHPPALKSVNPVIDKTIELDAVGLPACNAQKITARDTAAAKAACGDAIVGSGTAEVEVAFPEQAPFSATGPVVLFNGGVHGKTTLVLVHAYVAVPAPTAIVTKAYVTRIHRGRYGLDINADVPKIAGGAGSVTNFELKVGRDYTYKGQKKSLLRASCPTGSWATEAHVQFFDGTKLNGNHIFSCTPRG